MERGAFLYNKIAGIYSKNLNIDKRKYDLFFSFNNVFSVFRMKNRECLFEDSKTGEIIYFDYTSAVNPQSVLKEILFLAKINEIKLRINDIAVIRLNGQMQSYRFHGVDSKDSDAVSDCFVRIEGFAESERSEYINAIHAEKSVLSVLDGRLLHVSNINLQRYIPCAIDGRMYQTSKESFVSDYSLYVYDENNVHIADPGQKPFLQINVALLFFNQLKKKKKLLLLLDRYELEMIRDFCQLQKLALA